MRYTKGSIGRIFVLKFDNGDIMLKELNSFVRKERLKAATIIFIGALRKGDLVTGPKKPVMPPMPNKVSFKDAWETLGVGTIFTNAKGPQIHIHSAMGKKMINILKNSGEIGNDPEDEDPPPTSYSLIVNQGTGDGSYSPGTKVTIKADDPPVGETFDKWKVISSRSGHEHAGDPGKDGMRRVLSKIKVLPPGTICTETYLVIGVYEEESQAHNLVMYMKTRFFRFLLSLFMYSHSITKDTYSFIPILSMKTGWTDAKLYKRYGITIEEAEFIESKIKPMDTNSE